jgi:hypothetical protein
MDAAVVLFTPVASASERMALCRHELTSLEQLTRDGVAGAADATVASLSSRPDRGHPEVVRLVAAVQRRKAVQLDRAAATRDVLARLFERGLEQAMRFPLPSDDARELGSGAPARTTLRPQCGGQYLVNALLRDYGPEALAPENALVLEALLRHAGDGAEPRRRSYTVLVPGAGVAGLCVYIAQALARSDLFAGGNEEEKEEEEEDTATRAGAAASTSAAATIVVDAVDTSLPSLALAAGLLRRPQASAVIAKSFRVFPDATLTGLLRVTGVDEADAAEDGGVLVSVPHLGGGASALPRGTLLRLWHAAFHPRSLPPLPLRQAVVTRFFLDAVPDVFEAIDTVHARLSASGLWINLGPLKYHGYHAQGPRPTWEEIRTFATRVLGFRLLEERVLDRVPYFRGHAGSAASVVGETYRCTFSVMMK